MVPRVSPRIGALCVFAAGAIWLALFALGVLLTPGYTITGNRISDLGNPRNPAPWTLNVACIAAGLLFVPFAWALGDGLRPRTRLPGSAMLTGASAALIGVGLFPEESPYNLHFAVSALFFLLEMMAISHYAVAMYRTPQFGRLSGILSVIASGLALLFVVAVLVEAVGGTPLAGGVLSNVLEHATVFASLVWAAWNGTRMLAIESG